MRRCAGGDGDGNGVGVGVGGGEVGDKGGGDSEVVRLKLELSADAIREGTRREKATRGSGSSAMEEKEERVAPWYVDVDGSGRRAVTTATDCAVSRRSRRRS